VKADFATVDGQAVLAQVASLPIQSWRYRTEDPAVRHIGPMAQNFAAAFNVGDNDRHIHVVDGQGVALAAIQGLTQELRALQAANAALAARVADLEGRRDG
jgi:trimeric autotransporter adhesin